MPLWILTNKPVKMKRYLLSVVPVKSFCSKVGVCSYLQDIIFYHLFDSWMLNIWNSTKFHYSFFFWQSLGEFLKTLDVQAMALKEQEARIEKLESELTKVRKKKRLLIHICKI